MRKKNFLSTGPETRRKRGVRTTMRGLQNAIKNVRHTKFLTELWAFENRHFVRRLYEIRYIGKSNTNNLPATTYLTENPDGEFF